MKIISANVNGVRSAYNKGFFNWLKNTDADIICLQEIKANVEDLGPEITNFANYHVKFFSAQKKGYSGVAIYSKIKPQNIVIGLQNDEIDAEGRYLQFDFKSFSVASIYLPSGSSGPDKQEKKLRFLEFYAPILKKQAQDKLVLCGDFNIAHQEIDLKNWKNNSKNSGFLPEERDWFTNMLNLGYTDTWRSLYPSDPGYTWWSNRGRAYVNDVGWRIDYMIATKSIAAQINHSSIYKEQKFSDHAPLISEFQLS